ncbi:hypothetical protein BDV26DRAFT_203244 [Aspergillus bertholletiae]|uniref:Transmembrane protein n=1 Tax=Aspergillus bertholletiae TaxID=1226010 RepID=A0A5N7B7T7_9EURO|nr:hypothetical protein BDV26DRAFT_203244 [Aspergillus bertholletiae]
MPQWGIGGISSLVHPTPALHSPYILTSTEVTASGASPHRPRRLHWLGLSRVAGFFFFGGGAFLFCGHLLSSISRTISNNCNGVRGDKLPPSWAATVQPPPDRYRTELQP